MTQCLMRYAFREVQSSTIRNLPLQFCANCGTGVQGLPHGPFQGNDIGINVREMCLVGTLINDM